MDEKARPAKSIQAAWFDHVVDGPGEIPLLSIHGVKASLDEAFFPPDYDSFPFGSYFTPGIPSSLQRLNRMLLEPVLLCPKEPKEIPTFPFRLIGLSRIFMP